MQIEKGTWQRAAGYIVLVLIAGLIVLGWRVGIAGGGNTSIGEQPVSATPASVAAAGTVAGDPPAVEAAPVVADAPVLVDAALVPAAVPHTFVGHKPEHEFVVYRVERGDTPNGIADKFGIKATTLLGGNPLLSQESSLLQTGIDLVILPVDGVLHDVAPGDTLESISQQYSVPVETIVGYGPNNLEFPYRLYPETQVLVPGAVREVFVWTPPSLESVRGRSTGSGVTPLIVGTGTFIYPVGSRNFTQYFWYGHPGVDIALPEGTAVVASDTGTVTFAGWNIYGYGNLIVVNHGNGYETFYAHLSGISVVPGQIVYQGNVIGSTGNTGNSSGPHVHFEVRINGAQDNPCWYIGGC
ncbi:MAG TPA: peptidoglycan DD-metalloendopeptidase family protein [Promineifilum sp.]|nr:peptidoglycan DD-metalloendopeptidase family protein [Promineifilum sp.]HRO89965.1 peptidoglycan DD-metalloendopeptidase family protein [Promineifilum sp.]HRQ13948.1 peptidoglycan DD-metalloendopeptidase family protein [Promineifilum sp.]